MRVHLSIVDDAQHQTTMCRTLEWKGKVKFSILDALNLIKAKLVADAGRGEGEFPDAMR